MFEKFFRKKVWDKEPVPSTHTFIHTKKDPWFGTGDLSLCPKRSGLLVIRLGRRCGRLGARLLSLLVHRSFFRILLVHLLEGLHRFEQAW